MHFVIICKGKSKRQISYVMCYIITYLHFYIRIQIYFDSCIILYFMAFTIQILHFVWFNVKIVIFNSCLYTFLGLVNSSVINNILIKL